MEKKSNQVSDFVVIFKKVKPLFETRKGYGWDCYLENEVEDIMAVYKYKGNVYALTLGGADVPISRYSSKTRDKVREEAINWLKEQPQTQGKLKE